MRWLRMHTEKTLSTITKQAPAPFASQVEAFIEKQLVLILEKFYKVSYHLLSYKVSSLARKFLSERRDCTSNTVFSSVA